ncbi:MAG TPA: bifunctional UDP-N-acetylglucosamine diphosphorylase/glucosamine-1-phosphate N-acetyltransferase GlmU [Tepidiformaceae bacterium]|nr:bifunctional UDP-N-acetylglucosamine diphosphorylase/glucosamine-1-phosphate N-acetyltransferase GlmU [Tepidiformaceae bacterium]
MSGAGLGVVVLAAGQGTRMRSALPKVLHRVCGAPMAKHVIDAAGYLEPAKLIVVVGHEAEQVRTALAAEGVGFVEQTEMLGTGDAVKRCRQELSGCHEIMVLNGDCPLVGRELLRELVEARGTAPMAFATAMVEDAGRLGRLLRDAEGHPQRVVEAVDWRGEGGPAEINAGQYVFDAEWLWSHVDQIPLSAKGEHYLTELIRAASSEGRPGATVLGVEEDVLGVDDRIRLAEAERIMRGRILERHMLAGVTISDPSTTYIDAGVRLAQDVTVLPNCYLHGDTEVKGNSTVGPGTTLRNAQVGAETSVQTSVIEDSTIGDRVRVGPFAHVRGGSVIGDDCELGNYSEVKNSRIGRGVKMHHFSYMGDADVGEYSNIAAGAITCNWDGVNKNKTTIGARVFIGCDTMLVAPISVGDDAFTGAGAVVTKDVPAGGRVAGVPARPLPRTRS